MASVTYKMRTLTPFGFGDLVNVTRNNTQRKDEVAFSILDSVNGLGKIILGCKNMGVFTEYIRSPPLSGSLNLSNESQRKMFTDRLITTFDRKDQGWVVEYHESLESKETSFRDSAYN